MAKDKEKKLFCSFHLQILRLAFLKNREVHFFFDQDMRFSEGYMCERHSMT